MPTHVHLLIETGETSLAKVVQSLQFRYTRNFNMNYRTWGHLFQGAIQGYFVPKGFLFLGAFGLSSFKSGARGIG